MVILGEKDKNYIDPEGTLYQRGKFSNGGSLVRECFQKEDGPVIYETFLSASC